MGVRVVMERAALDMYEKLLKENGTTSCGKVAAALAAEGLKTPWTGRPPTRQTVWAALQLSERGRAYLLATSKAKWKTQPKNNVPK